jgi:uncharacterized protein YecT (DUF1311 family)
MIHRMLLPFSLGCLLSLISPLQAADEKEEPKLTLPQAKAKFEKADKKLNDTWAQMKKSLEESQFNILREDQRSWVAWRDYLAASRLFSDRSDDSNAEHPGKSAGSYSAAADFSEDRVKWLQAYVNQLKNPDETLTGHWSDSVNGDIDIVEKDGQIYFVFNVVRGRGANIGAIAGIARWHNRIGWFSDKGRDKTKTDEANISFVYKQPKLEVIEAGADYYHGHNALFDGDYIKVGPLDEKKQKEIIKAGTTGEVPEN